MKKVLIFSGLLTLATCYLSYVAFAGHGGDSFLGGFGGSMVGSMVGTSISQRDSGNSCGDSRAMREVRHLEDVMRRDFRVLEEEIKKLRKRVTVLEEQVNNQLE